MTPERDQTPTNHPCRPRRAGAFAGWTIAAACTLAGGCSDDGDGTFEMDFHTVPTALAAGENVQTGEWVAEPTDRDLDVLQISGFQSLGGHHATLVATPHHEPLGTIKPWSMTENLMGRILIGVNGSDENAVGLPEGYVFRIPAGSSLVVQTHYLNATETTLTAESELDLVVSEADPTHKVANQFFVTPFATPVGPADLTVLEGSCTLPEDVKLLMYANHMHEHGLTARSWMTDPSGVSTDLKVDPTWNGEWATAPNYTVRPGNDPLVIRAGTTIHTQCTYGPTGGRTIPFPEEMCGFFGFVERPRGFLCINENWNEDGGNGS